MLITNIGIKDTDKVLQIAKEEALKRGIKFIVVASTFGDTGVKAAKLLHNSGIKLIVITHNVGFKNEGRYELPEEKRQEIENYGGIIYTGTMVLRGLGAAIRDTTGGYSHEQIIANTLRIFGQGMKVCIEMAAMAADAGLITFDDVIAVAGTGRGADTCVVIKSNSSNKFFDIKVREILAKPIDF